MKQDVLNNLTTTKKKVYKVRTGILLVSSAKQGKVPIQTPPPPTFFSPLHTLLFYWNSFLWRKAIYYRFC